jgi:hypothetical protein
VDSWKGQHMNQAPTATGAIVAAGPALLLAACGGNRPSIGAGGPPSARASTSNPSVIGYSACMRSHGVANFPDPDSKGMPAPVDPQQLGVSSSQYQASEQVCQHLLPTGGSLQQRTQQCLLFGDCPPVLVQHVLNVERSFARCLRSHGVPNWPDPTISAKGGRPVFDLSAARRSSKPRKTTANARSASSRLPCPPREELHERQCRTTSYASTPPVHDRRRRPCPGWMWRQSVRDTWFA